LHIRWEDVKEEEKRKRGEEKKIIVKTGDVIYRRERGKKGRGRGRTK